MCGPGSGNRAHELPGSQVVTGSVSCNLLAAEIGGDDLAFECPSRIWAPTCLGDDVGVTDRPGTFGVDEDDVGVGALGNRPLRAGLIVENLFQRKLIQQLPLKFGVGAAYKPLNWIAVGVDIWRVLGHRGLDFAVGWELHESWARGFKGAAALRGGLSRIDATAIFSVGASFALGSLHWEYTLNKRFKGQTLGEATHLFASTVRF